jgi:hypothetical protein
MIDFYSFTECLLSYTKKLPDSAMSIIFSLLVFGLLGNLCIMRVFTRKRFTKILQVKSLFRFLAVSDTLYLIIIIIVYLDTKLNTKLKENSRLACKLISYFDYSLGSLPAWILSVISIERFISVAFSLSSFNSYFSKKIFQFTIGISLVIYNLVVYAPILAFNDLVIVNNTTVCDFVDLNSKKVLNLIDIVNSYLLPGILMFILSVSSLVCIKICKIHSVASLHGLMLERKHKRDKRFAIISILLNLSFLCLNSYRCFSFFNGEENFKGNSFNYSINFYLHMNAYTITFYILFFFNSTFRDEFLIMIRIRKQKF